MATVRDFPTIKAIRSFIIGGVGSGKNPSSALPGSQLRRGVIP
jgi:hypothetical protein